MTVQQLPAVDQDMIDRAVDYHGSFCPGLATGIQAARLALRELGAHSPDNPVVAVAETDICAVDALQALVGTTIGNRNLILRDHGKNAYTFYRNSDGRAVRIAGKPIWKSEYQQLRMRVLAGEATADEQASFEQATDAEANRILAADPGELFTVTDVDEPVPATSTVDPWLECGRCGEPVMETRTRHRAGQTVCIPCFEAEAANGHKA